MQKMRHEPRIIWIVFLNIIMLELIGCQSISTVSPANETRTELDALSETQTEAAETVATAVAIASEVSNGVAKLTTLVPEQLKNESRDISEKAATTLSLITKLQEQLESERATTDKVKKADIKKDERIAKISEEKSIAEKDGLKVKNQRNIFVLLSIMLSVTIAGGVYIRIKKIL
jgi:hypothetical protein